MEKVDKLFNKIREYTYTFIRMHAIVYLNVKLTYCYENFLITTLSRKVHRWWIEEK